MFNVLRWYKYLKHCGVLVQPPHFFRCLIHHSHGVQLVPGHGRLASAGQATSQQLDDALEKEYWRLFFFLYSMYFTGSKKSNEAIHISRCQNIDAKTILSLKYARMTSLCAKNEDREYFRPEIIRDRSSHHLYPQRKKRRKVAN